MKSKESYQLRLRMAKMHDNYIARLDVAMDNGNYAEAAWLCYAIFEQRVRRIMEKYIVKCPKQRRLSPKSPVGISKKIECLQKLAKVQYGAFADFDRDLLKDMKKWCIKRNRLIHGLISIEYDLKYDEEFKMLAEEGAPLAKKLYQEATKVRNWCNAGNQFGKFPDVKCTCKNRCIMEE